MATKPLPSPEVLRQLLSYEPETGKLFWKERPVDSFATKRASKIWNTRFAGREAGRISKDGYKAIKINRISHQSHRVAFAIFYGYWPKIIDHSDGDRGNNRISNIREATIAENSRNRISNPRSISRIKGVSIVRGGKKWRARICDEDGKLIEIGRYYTQIEAAQAYDEAAIVHHGKFARLNNLGSQL